jgi:hypothetical protein
MDRFQIRPEDIRALVELAETVEDRTPHEQAAVDRAKAALAEYERHSLDWAVDRSQNRGRGQ